MTDLTEFSKVVADLVLEDPDPAQRIKRARALMGQAAGMVVLLEGEEHAAETAFRVADRMVEGWN